MATKRGKKDLVCSFCGRPTDTDHCVVGMDGKSILCHSCMESVTESMLMTNPQFAQVRDFLLSGGAVQAGRPGKGMPEKGGRKHPQAEYIAVDTSNILFICGGAFVGLDEKIKARLGKKAIGFVDSEEAERKAQDRVLAQVQPEDLVSFGLIPEFVGRLPVVAKMGELSTEELVRILTEPKNAIVRQYQKLLAMDEVTLRFTDDALKAIAEEAQKRKTGARGLRSIMEQVMADFMYDLPGNEAAKGSKLVIDGATVKAKLNAEA